MPKEIERRFKLIQLAPDLTLHHPWQIHQAYQIIDEAAGREERVRYYRTPEGNVNYRRYLKRGRGRKRDEIPTPISVEEFKRSFFRCLGEPVIKDVYFEQYGQRWIQLHIFRSHRPLMTIEVEFDTEAEAEAYIIPDWFGPEVTDDRRYNSASVALYGVPPDFHPNEELILRFYGEPLPVQP